MKKVLSILLVCLTFTQYDSTAIAQAIVREGETVLKNPRFLEEMLQWLRAGKPAESFLVQRQIPRTSNLQLWIANEVTLEKLLRTASETQVQRLGNDAVRDLRLRHASENPYQIKEHLCTSLEFVIDHPEIARLLYEPNATQTESMAAGQTDSLAYQLYEKAKTTDPIYFKAGVALFCEKK